MRRWSLVSLLIACLLLPVTMTACDWGRSSTDAQNTSTSASAEPTTTAIPTTTTLPTAVWQAVTPTGELPGGRLGASLVYLPAGRLLLFGGWAGGTDYRNDLWTYDPSANAWAESTPEGLSPAPRAAHAAALDPVSGRLIVFGGFDGEKYYGDLWAYDPSATTWTELKPAGLSPTARHGHSLAYDPMSKTMILFGGFDGRLQYNDTWAYDPAANTWKDLKPKGDLPPARDSQALAYDSDAKRLVLFGGWSTTRQFDDTWAYDPAENSWAVVQTDSGAPVARALAQLVYDPADKTLVLFAGGDSSATFADTWLFDYAGRGWMEVITTGERPAARAGHLLLYDPASGDFLLFGGSDGIGAYFDDLWRLSR